MYTGKIKAALILISINIIAILMILTDGDMFNNFGIISEIPSVMIFGLIFAKNIGLNILNLVGIAIGLFEYLKHGNKIGKNTINFGISVFIFSLIFI